MNALALGLCFLLEGEYVELYQMKTGMEGLKWEGFECEAVSRRLINGGYIQTPFKFGDLAWQCRDDPKRQSAKKDPLSTKVLVLLWWSGAAGKEAIQKIHWLAVFSTLGAQALAIGRGRE